jgi:hypothetical protein
MAKEYKLITTSDKCYFNIDDFALANGLHKFVVKAKAEGFMDSPYSNEVEVFVKSGYTLTFGAWDDNYDNSRIIETINFADGTSETIDYHLANKTFYGVESITLQENEDEIWSINASGLYITSLSNRETVTLTLDSNAILYDYQK